MAKEIDLKKLVIEVDDQLIQKGVEPFQRPFHARLMIAKSLEAKQFSRLALGRYLMNTQFISGEILRQFSNRDFRSDFCRTPDEDWNITHRAFPKSRLKLLP